MVEILLGYNPTKKFGWERLPNNYPEEEYNGKLVVWIHELLWGKIKNIVHLKKKGYDSVILIDGHRRTGKSTLAMIIAYLLDPNITIDNYVAGLEEAPEKIEKAHEDSPLIFDEGSLVAGSKDAMVKKQKQLIKIIDVVGVKRLTLLFCMPSFFEINKTIAIDHSRFLIHVYTDEKLNRGYFAYFSTKKKKKLYVIGKKNHNSYDKPRSEFTGKFRDFHLPFEKEYMEIKKQSLYEALNPDLGKQRAKLTDPMEIRNELIRQIVGRFEKLKPNMQKRELRELLGTSETTYYRILKGENTSVPQSPPL